MTRYVCWSIIALIVLALFSAAPYTVSQIAVPSAGPVPSLPLASDPEAAAHAKIEAALKTMTEFDFHATPLSDVAAHLQATYKIPVIIDKRALDDCGLSGSSTVTITLRGVELGSLLKLALKDLGLTFVVRDQVLKITTYEEAEDELVSRL